MQHIYNEMQELKYRIDIEGYPCQRPRLGKFGNVHNPVKYYKYKKELTRYLKSIEIKEQKVEYVAIRYYFPYPKSEPKKNREDLAPYNRKYDVDNLIKSFFDALQDAGIVTDDRLICGVYAEKMFTLEEKGWIEFEFE